MKQLQAAMAPAIGKPMRLSCIDRRRRHSPFEQEVFDNKKPIPQIDYSNETAGINQCIE
ncbi:hypothetical protein [Delftia acidovorans]|uniref:Uncharacterized protein n=1 Tax=Delftia acidovorans TaxID=80866 RepID=A0AAJ2R1K1_DELAC|nr:hypothetical protein [Delftia acidovorans]MDX4954115.1 hypothetical protein [Delftia acidovorans]